MRDPERLDKFYDELKVLHKTYFPDWRFGQLMANFIRAYGDPFYLEESNFMDKISNVEIIKKMTEKFLEIN